jgi:hypothetical protein
MTPARAAHHARPWRTALAAASFCALLAAPSAARQPAAPLVTLHVDEAEAPPGADVSIFLRTYAPRPLGQGQLCIVVKRPATRRTARALAPGASPEADTASAIDRAAATETPFVELLGGEVFSDLGDAVADFLLADHPEGQELRIDFASPSVTVNTSDLGPLARLDFRLSPAVEIGDTFVLELDLAHSLALDRDGLPVPLGSAPGHLFIVEPGTRAGAGLLRFAQRTFVSTESARFAVVTVERVRGSDGEVGVEVHTAPGTATAGLDHDDASEVVTWQNGELGSRTFHVPLLADDVAEPTETVALALGSVGGGARVDPVRRAAVLAILDAPALPAVPKRGMIRLTGARFQSTEGAGELLAEVERIGSAEGAVSVDFATADLSAEAGSDYEPAAGNVSFADGERGPKPIAIEIFEDDRDEGLELAELRLVRARGGAQLDADGVVARLELVDDDAPEETCVPGPFAACLHGGRFLVRAHWRTEDDAGPAWAESVSDSSGYLWFFSPENAEVLFKVLDACAMPGAPGYWVGIGAATPIDYTVVVTDVQTGVSKEYTRDSVQSAPLLDSETFRDCP